MRLRFETKTHQCPPVDLLLAEFLDLILRIRHGFTQFISHVFKVIVFHGAVGHLCDRHRYRQLVIREQADAPAFVPVNDPDHASVKLLTRVTRVKIGSDFHIRTSFVFDDHVPLCGSCFHDVCHHIFRRKRWRVGL